MTFRNHIERAIYAAAFVAEYNRSLKELAGGTYRRPRLEIASTDALSVAERTVHDYRAALERKINGSL